MPPPLPQPKRKQPDLPSSGHDSVKKARSNPSAGSQSNLDTSNSGAGESRSLIQPAIHHRTPSLDGGPKAPVPRPSSNLTQATTSTQATPRTPPTAPAGPTESQHTDETPWTGLEKAVRALHITTKIIPPLHSAIDNLRACLDVFKQAAKSRKDYDELATGLKAMVELLDKHLTDATPKEIMDTTINIVKKITRELESVDKRQSRSGVRRVLGESEDEGDLIRRYRRIEQLFRQLQNTQLEGLCPVKLACFDSELSMDIGRRSCTENTRTKVLTCSMVWADNPTGAKIYWMNGMAGTGKTTIAYSLCEALTTTGQLAASFFCTRTSHECRESKRIIPTIAYQLARRSAPFRHALCGALDEDPDIGTRIPSTQFELLLARPLQRARDNMANNLIVVIDALDECSDPHVVKHVLNSLFRFAEDLPVKFFVTSRPEPAIRTSMMAGINAGDRPHSILYLHEIEKSLVEADIELYLKDELKHLLPTHRADIEELAKQAGNLFIYAATAIRYIQPGETAANTKQRLKTILEINKSRKSLSGLDELYSAILSTAINNKNLETNEQDIIKSVLWTAICACEPVLINTLASLAGFDEADLAISALQPLQSVLHVSEHNGLVTTLHASFPDYMFSQERSQEFFCDKPNHDQFLARRCLQIMKAQLRFNICQIESSFTLDDELSGLGKQIDTQITPELFYASQFWVEHLSQAEGSSSIFETVQEFLSQRLLFWMEIMSLKKCMVAGAVASIKMHTWLITSNASPELITLARDAQSIVGKYASHPVSSSTPHIYISALALSSPTNRIHTIYRPRFTGLIHATGTFMDQVDQACIAAWSSGSPIRSVSSSADCKYIVLGDNSGRITVRHPHSGKQLITIQAHQRVISSVAFSSDASLIASSSHDRTLCIWSRSDGSLVSGPFEGHTNRVNSVAFSPDGMRLVSSSDDHTIRTWATNNYNNLSPGQLKLTGDPAPVKSAVFSPDGLQIASCSGGRDVHVWDAVNGTLLHRLQGHTRSASCVRYSPCGRLIFSGSNDGTIRTWDTHNGTSIGNPFKGHSNHVTSIAVSPEGERIVSGSLDCTVRVWHRASGDLLAGPFEGHMDSVRSVKFSEDGTRIISASDDKTIRVWNAQGKMLRNAKDDRAPETSSALLSAVSPSGTHIASGHTDGHIRIWNVQDVTLETKLPLQGSKNQGILLLTFSSDGTRIFAAYKDGVLRVFNVKTAELVGNPRRFSPHELVKPQPIALSSSGRSAVSTGGPTVNQVLDLWDLRANRQVYAIKTASNDGPFEAAVFSSNAKRLATGTRNGIINLWDGDSGQQIAGPFKFGTNAGLISLSISSDGTRLLYRFNGEGPAVYNVANETRTTLSALIGTKSHDLDYVKFSPNGTHIIFATRGGAWSIGLYTHDVGGSGGGVKSRIRVPGRFDLNITGLEFMTDESCLISAFDGGEMLVHQLCAGSHNALHKSDVDGWILDENSKKVIWVPPEVRSRFPQANGSSFTEDNSITVDYDNLLIGDNWSRCYIGE
ncbi:hypothetical protein FRC11_000671 [Ceratobasidium sp. 423]|nr:hypothetical protein FRC11_000671 [Ceratobasidium sp. 423]